MAKRKAEDLTPAQFGNEVKKAKHAEVETAKKAGLLDDSDSSSDEDSGGGVKLEPGLKINEEYAKRFEHNSKREELQRLEEKYNKPAKPAQGQYGDKYDEVSESSEDEDEDDDGYLVTQELDAEISATMQALRSKDPRVYDEKVTFYKPIEESEGGPAPVKAEKPMYLRDYHRENLLKGVIDADEEETPRTFAQEEAKQKLSAVKEFNAAVASSEDDDEDGGFMMTRSKPGRTAQGVHTSRAGRVKVNLDVEAADKDPEMFLSNFMAARAWVPGESSTALPFESDDEEEDDRAEKFEAAYNLRFEDPTGSNELLKSYARDIVAAKSVRREEPNSRKKQRDAQRERKEAEKRERDEERARLRQLKLGEMEEKLQKIKKAAGMNGKTLKDEAWSKFLDEDWADDRWDIEMTKRFGKDYYAEQDGVSEEDEEIEGKEKKKLKKPKWDDDIDINDLVPDFADEADANPAFTLSDSDDEDVDHTSRKGKTNKDRQLKKQAAKKAARLERKKIEELVDNQMDLDLPSSKQPSLFRYRETSPTAFGLTARDILMAPDAQLNQFAGLKKMASFRDPEKKIKDKKHLGKKARLRQWRKETFGNEEGPEMGAGIEEDGEEAEAGESKKKKRSRKSKGPSIDA